jgi:hypothetical protein
MTLYKTLKHETALHVLHYPYVYYSVRGTEACKRTSPYQNSRTGSEQVRNMLSDSAPFRLPPLK